VPFHIESTPLNGLQFLHADVYKDERGFFMEVFRNDRFADLGLPVFFMQDNHSRSAKGVLRGLHFQWNPPQGKLLRVTAGTAFLAIVDIRKNSGTLGKHFTTELTAGTGTQLWIPPGFANGFYAVSEILEVQYKCTAVYNSAAEGSIRWNDPALGIRWPVSSPVLSQKDASAQTLAEWLKKPESDLFRVNG
jgi:dTDP-4-dehydrorhamnose 3,5-epimerase